MNVMFKIIMFVILFGIVGTVHRTLDTSTWLAESKLAASQVEDSNEVVIGMQVADEGRKTMNLVFGCIYVMMVIGAAGSIGKPLIKKVSKEIENVKEEKKNDEK